MSVERFEERARWRARGVAPCAVALLVLGSPASAFGAGVQVTAAVDAVGQLEEALPGALARDDAKAALAEEIDGLLSSSPMADSRVGVHVVSLASGEEIFARGADTQLNPASNIKLVTAAAALELLGPEYQFKTEIWVDEVPDGDGVINGNIYIKGFGDPSFVTERMVRLTLDLWNLGVRRVTGDIVVDETFFFGRREGPGWDQESSDRPYIAPVGAVSLNRNAVGIHVRPGSAIGGRAVVTIDPDSRYFEVENRVITGSRRTRLWHRTRSIEEGNRQRIVVRGVHPVHFRPRTYWRRIDNPPHYFAHTFRAFMRRQGVRFNRWRIRGGEVPESAKRIHTSHSEPLAGVIGPLNKFSNNHVAEMLVKVIGAEVRGEPGTWEKGSDAVAELLELVGIEPGSYVFRNGSGLNDVNRFSPRQMTALLAHMWDRFQTSPEFVVSLPVAARDGTTRWRMEEAEGWVRAKTGTLQNVSGLSGYVGTPEGEVLAFSIIVNDYPGRLRETLSAIDAMAVSVASFGGATEMRVPRVVPPGPVEAVTDLQERAALYLALHAAADTRNIRYLKRSIEVERDGVLRALAADAIYESDREVGAPILLDEFEPSLENLGRLRRLAGGPMHSLPVLSSIVDLATEGIEPAIALFLKASGNASGDQRLEPWFVETLTEVGRAAPKEMLARLMNMKGDPAAAATELLVEGLKRDADGSSGDERHPFREALGEARAILTTGAAIDCPDAAAAAAAAGALSDRLDALIEGGETEPSQEREPSRAGDESENGTAEPEPAEAVPAAASSLESGVSARGD